MAAGDPITDLSELINLRTTAASSEDVWCYIDGRIGANAILTFVAGRYHSLWRMNKTRGGSGDAPSTARALDNTTQGALKQSSPATGAIKRLCGATAVSNLAGTLLVYDRLVDSGGLVGNDANAQTTNLPTAALPRFTDGLGNFIFVEITTLIGASGTTATINYTDTNDDARTTPAFNIGATGLREAERFIKVPLEVGYEHLGVKTITNFDLVATTGTAGDIAVGIGREITSIPCPGAGGSVPMDFISGPQVLPSIGDDACIAFAFNAGSVSTTPTFDIATFFVEK